MKLQPDRSSVPTLTGHGPGWVAVDGARIAHSVIVLSHASRHAMQFAEFYARADALMYEAKASGRNRLAYERMTVFSEPPVGRRRDKAG